VNHAYYAYQVPSSVYVLPETLGATIKATARELAVRDEKAAPETLLYAEKAGGFSCRTCKYATAVNVTHGRCAIMQGSINLDEGCCAAWDASWEKLHLYRDQFPQSERVE
jgi:hypothetical protein